MKVYDREALASINKDAQNARVAASTAKKTLADACAEGMRKAHPELIVSYRIKANGRIEFAYSQPGVQPPFDNF